MAAGLKEEIEAVRGCVPRYLYRTYSNNSHGTNTLATFEPGSKTYTDNLSELPDGRARDMLQKHLLWEIFPADEFVSWTNSLLWALQHAIRKDSRRERDVKICVLDTSKIDTRSFFAVSNLLCIYKVADRDKLTHRYYSAEYLYHGGLSVHGSSSTVPFNRLRECGLFSLLPEMDDPTWKSSLWNAVARFRNVMCSVPQPIAPGERRAALRLASLFEKELRMPVMVALLALRRRDPDDSSFLTLVVDYAVPTTDFMKHVPSYIYIDTEAPELQNCAKLMNAAYREIQRAESRIPDQMTDLQNTFDTLSVSRGKTKTTLKAIPDTELSPSVRSELSTARETLEGSKQALTKDINVKKAKDIGEPHSRSEQSRPKPFPAHLPSGLRTEKDEAAPMPKPKPKYKSVHVGIVDSESD